MTRRDDARGHAATDDASHEVAARLREVADRLEELSTPAAVDLLADLGDPARAFLRTAERLIARAAWRAAPL